MPWEARGERTTAFVGSCVFYCLEKCGAASYDNLMYVCEMQAETNKTVCAYDSLFDVLLNLFITVHTYIAMAIMKEQHIAKIKVRDKPINVHVITNNKVARCFANDR